MVTYREDVGKRLVPHVIDDLAQQDPLRVLYEVPVGGDLSKGYHRVTTAQYANAINRASWWLEDKLGKPKGGFPTVGYIGPGKLLLATKHFPGSKLTAIVKVI